MFHLFLLFLPLPKIFFNIGFAISPRSGAAEDATKPKGNPFSFCFCFLFFLPYTFFYYLLSSRHFKKLFIIFIYLFIYFLILKIYSIKYTIFYLHSILKSLHQFDLLYMFYVLMWVHFLIKHLNTLIKSTPMLLLLG